MDPTSSARTLSGTFCDTVVTHGSAVAIRDTVAKKLIVLGSQKFADNFEQISYTWDQYNQGARSFAKALIAEGVWPGRAVTIQGSNSSHWLFANIGTILAGGISTGVYPTNNADLSKHAVVNSNAEVVVVEDEKQLQKYAGVESSALKCFVVWNKVQNEKIKATVPGPVYTWDEFVERGKDVLDETLDDRIKKQQPEQVCSLIYTSGTTGLPKAAALTHDNLTWTAASAGRKFSLHAGHHGLSYLPLSHIAAQQLDCVVPIQFGYRVDIAPADALKGNNLRQHIVNSHPTYFLAVPRVWEKFKEGMEQKLETALPRHKRALFNIGTALGRWANRKIMHLSQKNPASLSCVDRISQKVCEMILSIFNKLIYMPIKIAMGLDRCQIAASGAGVLDPKVANFFAGLNIRIIDLYGMSESSGPATIALDPDVPSGSCGKPLDGTEVVINDQDANGEGEIRFKGRNIFKGYWANPFATHESFDKDGFFRTGDIGKLDAKGNLFITGRLKELIKTSGGENIPPVRIEQKIKQELPILSQAVVLGDKKNFLTCLLTLKTEQDSPNALAPEVLEELAKLGSDAKTVEQAVKCARLREHLNQGIIRANRQADSQAQCVQKFEILQDDFTVANGLMTPTLKLKRSEISKRYAEQINKMYQE